jgi:XTP/dITP diphosphohydrolase
MQQLLIATTNKGKIAELGNFLKDLPVKLVSLKDVGITQDVEETGNTYQENSQLKAKFYAKLSGLSAISDDGGLEIAAYNGAPGLKSRRWLGYEASDEVLVDYMKKVAKELPENNRNAKFVTVVSFALPTGEVWSERGEVSGIIAREPHLKFLKGYPYRSFFYLPAVQKFYHESELTPEEEKEYNHRWKAVEGLKDVIEQQLSLRTK